MDTQARINWLEYKCTLLANRGRENAAIIRKYQSELRRLKGIPKLEVKWTMATNTQAFSAEKTKTAKKK